MLLVFHVASPEGGGGGEAQAVCSHVFPSLSDVSSRSLAAEHRWVEKGSFQEK